MTQGTDGRGHRIRDIVKFQIEEYLVAAGRDPLDQSRAVPGEKLQSDFHPDDFVTHPIKDPHGLALVRHVERENKFAIHGGVLWNRRPLRHGNSIRATHRSCVYIRMSSVTVSSPAKINLFLAVTGKRSDEFHDLVSLVAPVEFGDEIQVTTVPEAGKITLECDDPDVPTGLGNLAVRAAEEYRMGTGITDGVLIRLRKCIPMGAGLGGASSNAAAVLSALNQIYEGRMAEKDLHLVAASLGCDCPLFLFGEPCIMRGRGEKLSRLPESVTSRLSGRRLLLFKPDFSISTPWAYSQLADMAPAAYTEPRLAEAMLSRWLGSTDGPESLLFNSFTTVVDRKYVALPVVNGKLCDLDGILGVMMTGSGSASFAVLEDDADTAEARQVISDCLGNAAFVVETRIQ